MGARKEQHQSPATEIQKGQHLSPTTEFKQGQIPWIKGKHLSNETKRKISEAKKGKYLTDKHKHKISMALQGHTPWNKKDRPAKSKLESLYLNEKLSALKMASLYEVCESTVRNWLRSYGVPLRNQTQAVKLAFSNPELIKQCLPQKPNRKEKALDSFLQAHFPNEWKYVGTGEVNLGGRYPDWINVNGKKQVIELFGTYWHDPFVNPRVQFTRTEVATRYHYSQYGFDCLIIWQKELDRPIKLLRKIKEFSNG